MIKWRNLWTYAIFKYYPKTLNHIHLTQRTSNMNIKVKSQDHQNASSKRQDEKYKELLKTSNRCLVINQIRSHMPKLHSYFTPLILSTVVCDRRHGIKTPYVHEAPENPKGRTCTEKHSHCHCSAWTRPRNGTAWTRPRNGTENPYKPRIQVTNLVNAQKEAKIF